jgi:TM2 domain-containing membrane protein YozV
MDTPKSGAKDPAIAVGLSLLCPGLGHLYAGRIGSFVLFLAAELWLFTAEFIAGLVVVHVFQAVAAGGAAKLWNARHAASAAIDVAVPPPPPAGAGRARPAVVPTATLVSTTPPPPPPPPPARLVLDADSFLEEMQTCWREHRSGHATAREFADRKWRAIRAVRVESREEGEALVTAARELSEAGVMTSEEIGQLASRVATS